MRIIAGTVGGRRLQAPRGQATRPTSDKVRAAIFNILCARGEVPERVLDLYAGSGALGLEALSRGAREAVLVDQASAAVESVRQNAAALGLEGRARVVKARVIEWLERATPPATGQFGWVFLDPPYDAGELDRALAALAGGECLAAGAVAVAEHEHKSAPKERHGRLHLADRRQWGQTAVSFYE